MKFATKPIRHYPVHLRHVVTLPLEIKKLQFFADIQQIWKKMQTNNMLSSLILIFKKFVCQPLCCVPLHIQTFYQNLVFVTEYHVNCGQALLKHRLW